MYSILGTGDILVRMYRSKGKMKVNQHRSTRMSATVGTSSTLSCTLTRRELSLAPSHGGNRCVYVQTHIELFRGMYSILGTGDKLVRMLRSWGEMKINQHRSTRMSATVGTSSILSCTLTRRKRMRICSHAYRTIQRYL